MAKRNTKVKRKETSEMQKTPEVVQQERSEQAMMQYIEDHGIGAMVEKQIEWKTNDASLKLVASCNIKAWFETRGELIDIYGEATVEEVNLWTKFKTDLYDLIVQTYQGIKTDIFGFDAEAFENPFMEIWNLHTVKDSVIRHSMEGALKELYAWTILGDAVQWASGINTLVKSHHDAGFEEDDGQTNYEI